MTEIKLSKTVQSMIYKNVGKIEINRHITIYMNVFDPTLITSWKTEIEDSVDNYNINLHKPLDSPVDMVYVKKDNPTECPFMILKIQKK